MEPVQPVNEEKTSGANGRRRQWALAVVAIVVLLAAGLLVDFGRQAAGGEDLVPWEAGLERGSEVARESGKPMLVNFTADWCPPCQEMKRTVFSQPNVAETISADFVPVKVDMTVQRPGTPASQAAERYGVSGIPTYMLLNAEGQLIATPRVGMVSEDDLLAWLASVQ